MRVKYDSLVTKLAGYTLNSWKGDFEDGQPVKDILN